MRTIAPFRTECHPEAIRPGWLKDLKVIRVDRLSVTSQPRSLRGCSRGAK
jgi:hypothetical protein